MKAVIFHEHGGPEVLHYEDIDVPEPGPGEALVRVGACSLNRGPDTMVRAGGFGLPGFTLPHVCGADPAGEVARLGPDVESVAVGDRVVVYPILWCGECDMCRKGIGENYCRNFRVIGVHTWGGHAEYIRVPARNLVPLPDAVTYEQASTLSVSYITTWHGLVTKAKVTPEDTVLVMAAGSGVGSAAIDIAKMVGARVIAATGSDWKVNRAREVGADAVVNYNDEGWAAEVREMTDGRGVTVLFDNIGRETWSQSVYLLDRTGRAFCSGATGSWDVELDLRWLYRNMITLHFHMQGTKAELAEVARLVGEGKLHPVIDSRYPLSEAATAQQKLADQGQFGKVVLVPNGTGTS